MFSDKLKARLCVPESSCVRGGDY